MPFFLSLATSVPSICFFSPLPPLPSISAPIRFKKLLYKSTLCGKVWLCAWPDYRFFDLPTHGQGFVRGKGDGFLFNAIFRLSRWLSHLAFILFANLILDFEVIVGKRELILGISCCDDCSRETGEGLLIETF